MERVARRFLLHNRRDTEDAKENDFDDLKQELNMAKFEKQLPIIHPWKYYIFLN